METIAEGVETEGQVRFTRAEGCRHVQGFRFAPALAADEIRRMLADAWRFDVSGDETAGQPVIIACSGDSDTRAGIHDALRHTVYRIVDVTDHDAVFRELERNARVAVVLADARDGPTAADLLQWLRDLYPTIGRALISPSSATDTLRRAVNGAAVNRLLSVPMDADELQREIGAMVEECEEANARTEDIPPRTHSEQRHR